MPTNKFKLKDPKYCNGCDKINEYFGKVLSNHKGRFFQCKVFKHLITTNSNKIKINRPKSCIEKLGE